MSFQNRKSLLGELWGVVGVQEGIALAGYYTPLCLGLRLDFVSSHTAPVPNSDCIVV